MGEACLRGGSRVESLDSGFGLTAQSKETGPYLIVLDFRSQA